MDDWARFLGREYYHIPTATVGRVVRREIYRGLLHFWLAFPDRCTRCRLGHLVGVEVFPTAVAAARMRQED